MKNPVTFSIHSARSVQRKRQIRNIILLVALLVLFLGGFLILRVSVMKKEISEKFPSESGTTSQAAGDTLAASSETIPTDSSVPTTIASTETSTTDTSSTDATDSTATSDPTATEPISTDPVAFPAEENVYIPDSEALQTITHQVRDSAYDDLQDAVANLIASHPEARIGFSYVNLINSEAFGINDCAPFVVGGAVNLPINLILYNHVYAQTITLDQYFAVEETDILSGSGTLSTASIGTNHYLRELSNLSLVSNDNTANSMILRSLGGIDTVYDELRSISSVIDYRVSVTYTDYASLQWSGMNRMSTEDLAEYAESFYSDYMMYPNVYQSMFNDLSHTDRTIGVGSGLPSDVLVCHKSGANTKYGSNSDVAIIFCEEPFIVSVSVECADDAAGKAIEQQLGTLVYDYIHSCYVS